jgi:hypothetical protein
MKDLTITAHRFDHREKFQRIERGQVRDFANVKAQIIYHSAPADVEPRAFVCRSCRHTFELCTCKEVTL